MNSKRNNSSYSPDARYQHPQDSLTKLRTTMLKLQERTSDLYLLRNSFSTHNLRNTNLTNLSELRGSDLHNKNKKPFKTLKNTLDLLQNKINSAKEELQIPISSMHKKNNPYIEIDNKDQKEEDERERGPSDSNITQKIVSKKITSIKTSKSKPKNAKVFTVNPYSPRRHSTYYVSETVRAINQKNSLALDHVNASIKMMKACEAFQIPHVNQVEHRKLNLKKHEMYKNKKSLILDLDQTLIHCVENLQSETDMKIQLKIDGTPIQVGINIRPYALTFLRKMAQKYQIIIFTASHHSYADAILDELDPQRQIFQHRLYRHHCHVLKNELHVKDLRIINRSPSEMILVDNAAYSYAFQLQNGIPILPFYEGSDFELAALENYLQELNRCEDVRQLNKKTFKLHHYSKFFNGEQLIEQLYMNNFH